MNCIDNYQQLIKLLTQAAGAVSVQWKKISNILNRTIPSVVKPAMTTTRTTGISTRLINGMFCALSDSLPTEALLMELRCITRSTCKLTFNIR